MRLRTKPRIFIKLSLKGDSMETIAIVNRKGGTGKTATTHALGAGLRKKGYTVLYIDLDSQCNLSYSLGTRSNGLYNSFTMLTASNLQAEEAIQHTPQGDVIPAAEALATADTIITETGKEYRLKEAIQGLKYDYVIIDTPAQLGIATINALTAANSVIIPVQAEIYSLQGIGQLNKAIESVKKYCNSYLKIRGILLTRYNGRAVISKDIQASLQDTAEQLHTQLFNTTIRECISVKEAQAMQQDIFSYAPRSNAAKDYEAFIDEFLKQKRGKK